MSRDRGGFRPELDETALEPRELLSGTSSAEISTQIIAEPPLPRDLFHKNGIDGLALHASFVNRMNDRLAAATTTAGRVNADLNAFTTAYEALPVSPPAGSSGPTVSSLTSQLKDEVTYAVSTLEVFSNRPGPSLAKYAASSPHVGPALIAPLSGESLVPFARSQVDELGARLAGAQPVVGPNGVLTNPDPTPAVNSAANAILNAIAEFSIHPNLFRSPTDFYISPNVTFTTSSTGSPASSSPGFFVRGPHAEILPGAILPLRHRL